MGERILGWAGAVGCWLYAAAWAATWWSSAPLPTVLSVLEPIVSGRSHAQVSAALAGLIIFGTAPFMREQEWIRRLFFGIGIVALIAPGLWLAAKGQVGLTDAVLWLALPIVIAAWMLRGTNTPLWGR